MYIKKMTLSGDIVNIYNKLTRIVEKPGTIKNQ